MSSSFLLNLLLIAVILIAIVLFVLYRVITIGKRNETKEELERELFHIYNVSKVVQDEISSVTSINLYNQGYTPDEFERQSRRLKELKEALRNCNTGNISAKIYVREYIYDILKNKVDYDDNTINWTIPFNTPNQLTIRDKFDILLYVYSKKYQKQGLGKMLEEYDLTSPKEDEGYYVSHEDIEKIYKDKVKKLSFEDKLRIITQRIYAHYKGFGVIDDLRDASIDGVSGGVSGIPNHIDDFDSEELIIKSLGEKTNGFNSIWIMYKGSSIHLRFLEFESEAELRRVVQNVYKYNAPGQLSETKPYIINEMADGSRVTAARPPFSNSWAFFVRKKYDAKKLELETLIPQENGDKVIALLTALARGARTIAFTGAQGSGKTTLLMSFIGKIHRALNIRTIETAFELNLRKLYPLLNILSFQETANITGQNALDFQKKTDGHVSVLGEVATHEVASQMIQAAQVASLFTLFTHHAKTATLLVESIRNSLLQSGAFKDEISAERQVVEVLEFNVHLKQDYDGNRYIERITQIIPIETKQEDIEDIKNLSEEEQLRKLNIIYLSKQIQTKTFITKNIIEFKDGRYVPGERITSSTVEAMKAHMSFEEAKAFDELTESWWKEV